MKILAHRGYWQKPEEKNTLGALKSALEHGYGFESDLRDYAGQLAVSHDMATLSSPAAEDVIANLAGYGDAYTFAVNIKADGLGDLLANLLDKYHVSNYFLFDMSVAQMVYFAERKFRFYTRHSDVETVPVLYRQAAGIWLDSFYDTAWPTPWVIREHLRRGKEVCLVSPELHQREPLPVWQTLKEQGFQTEPGLLLCTDRPDKARDFFGLAGEYDA